MQPSIPASSTPPENVWRQALMALPSPAFVLDAQQCLLEVSDAMLPWLAQPRAAILGKPLQSWLAKTPEMTGAAEVTLTFRRDGGLAELRCRRMPLAGGQTLYAGEAEASSLQLQQARDQAERANRIKNELIGNLSLEGRTLMSSIVGIVEVALFTELTDRQREYLMLVREETGKLLDTVQDMIEYSRVETGELALESVPFSLRDVLETSLTHLAALAHNKLISLQCDLDPDVPDLLSGDAARLTSLLRHLLGNAVKYTQRGQISVYIGIADLQADTVTLGFEITDSGVGIAADRLGELFRPLAETTASAPAELPRSVGLGLTVAHHLIKLMDGQIAMESTPGIGSVLCFTARFRLQREAPAAPPVPRPLGTDKPSVLLVEDNEINQRFFTLALQKYGCEVTLAGHGQQAVELMADPARHFHLVLMDVNMPIMDGFDATRAIRAQEPEGQHVPIVALTARALPGDRQKCLDSGMDDYLAKPVQHLALVAALDRHLGTC